MKRWLALLVFLVAATRTDLYPQLGAFARVLALIEQSYIERIPPEQLVEKAIAGMLKGLDKHSELIPAATYKVLRGDTATSVAHVGIDARTENGRLVICGLLPDGPAMRSGLRLGDVISQPVDFKGAPGSKLVVTIERSGFVVPRKFTLVREPLPDIAVSVSRSEGWIVAAVNRFPDRMARMFEETVSHELQKGPAKGLVLDLRGNPGGLIEEAVRLLDLFLDDGTVLIIVGRDNKVIDKFTVSAKKRAWTFPVSVLIDNESASAAEIVAAALQDHKRAKVFGETSYGKGSVQTIVELDDGSAVRLTTALYFTPSMRKVEGHGVAPDVALSAPKEAWIKAAAGAR